MIRNFYSWAHRFDQSFNAPGAGHFRRKEVELEVIPLTLNRLQALLLNLAGPWAQRRIPIFGGRTLSQGRPIDGGFRGSQII